MFRLRGLLAGALMGGTIALLPAILVMWGRSYMDVDDRFQWRSEVLRGWSQIRSERGAVVWQNYPDAERWEVKYDWRCLGFRAYAGQNTFPWLAHPSYCTRYAVPYWFMASLAGIGPARAAWRRRHGRRRAGFQPVMRA